MEKKEYKKKLRDIEVKADEFVDEQEDLLFNITLQNDRLAVDCELLVEALLYYRAKV